MKIRRDRADKLFSDYIRIRDGWRCQKCKKYYPPPTKALHCCHFVSRTEQNTREDPENADTFCMMCHVYYDSHPEEFRQFKLNQLGQDRYDALILRGSTYKKKDRKMAVIITTAMLEDLKNERSLEEKNEG